MLGPRHPDTLTWVNNLAGLLYEQGKLAEAEPLYHEALKGRRELLGPRHPDTLSSAKWAAKLLNESGRAEEAARLRSEYGV